MARRGPKLPPKTTDLRDAAETELAPQLTPTPVDEPPESGSRRPLWVVLALGVALALAGPLLGHPATQAPAVAELALTLGGLGVALVAAGGVLRLGQLRLGPPQLGAILASLGALFALVAQRLGESAWPDVAIPLTAPLRTSLQGLSIPLCAAIALGATLTWLVAPVRAARGWLALGLLGLGAVILVPQGWLGASVAPLQAAIFGLDIPNLVDGAVQLKNQALPGAGVVLAAGATLVAGGFLLLRADVPRVWLGALVAALVGIIVAGVGLSGHVGHLLESTGLLLVGAAGLSLALVPTDAEPEASQPTDPWQAVEIALVLLVVAAWLILKVNGMRYSTTDEALYYYAARLWSEGKWPYRDFFFSHPPLHIAVPALAYKVLGYDFLVGKWISTLASLAAGVAVWRIARRVLGIPAGLLALTLDLFAAEVLQSSTNLTGVNLTTCWMMWGVWAILRGRYFIGGALLGAAAATGFYALGMMLAMVGMLAFLPWGQASEGPGRFIRQPAIRVFGGFLAVWGSITALGIALAGDQYTQGVFTYHFAKKAKVEGFLPVSGGPPAWLNNVNVMLGAKDFTTVLYYHAVHLWLALVSPLAVAAVVWLRSHVAPVRVGKDASAWDLLWSPRRWWQQPDPGHRLVIFTAAVTLVGEFGQFKERYDFYWALILPLLSICAAGVVAAMTEIGSYVVGAQLWRKRGLATTGVVWVGILALLCLATMPINNAANTKAYPSEFRVQGDSKGAGEVLTFEWLDPPGPPWLGEITRAVFWSDTRVRGNIETGIHHYLWNKKRWFSKAEEMAAWIRDHSAPTDTITGASDYAPLLALLSGRRLAADHVDTNSKVFDTKTVRIEKFWDDVCRDHLKFVVVAPMSYFAAAQLPKRATIMTHFQQDKVFHDDKLKHWKDLEMELWVRKSDAPCQYEGVRTDDAE